MQAFDSEGVKCNLRMNVTHDELGNLDIEAFTLAPINTGRNFGISFDPELSFKKQIDTVVKNCNFQIHCGEYCFSCLTWLTLSDQMFSSTTLRSNNLW